jgi:hypothetical protein
MEVGSGMNMTWASILTVLGVVNASIALYRAIKGTNKDEMTYFRSEVMNAIGEVKDDVESQAHRLDAHIDRLSVEAPKKPRRKPSAGE